MNYYFTRILAAMAFIFFTSLVYGQDVINNLSITEPAEIAGNYPAFQSDWGRIVAPDWPTTGAEPGTFVADGVGVETDGCQSPIENVSDKIAFIDRGGTDCRFSLKALHAQQGGATTVVICNNEPGAGVFAGGGGVEAPQVTIPVFFVSYETCQTIRMVLEGGEANVLFNYYCGVPNYGPEVIWGEVEGEGDFNEGLNGWYVENDATSDTTWAWTDNPTVEGAWTSATPGGTACNGYMSFPSDFYDTAGIRGQTGAGDCPNNNFSFCIGSLFSPTIDISDVTVGGLFVGVQHDVRYWNSGSTHLIVSYDDGATWPDSIHMSSGGASAFTNPFIGNNDDCSEISSPVNRGFAGYINVPVPNYNNQGTIKLQFRHVGAYYHATIDDVTLINTTYKDVEILRNFYGQAPAINIPLSQAQEIPLHVDINNRGNIDVDDATIIAEAFDPAGNIEATYTNDGFGVQRPNCFANENLTFPQTHTPSQVGDHRISYQNITPDDILAINDTLSFPYRIVSDDEPWLSAYRPNPGSGTENLDGNYSNLWTGLTTNDPTHPDFPGYDYAVAYTFYLPKGKGKFLNSVRFGMNDKPGNSGDVKVYLYLWNPTAGSSFAADDTPLDERPFGAYNITPEDRILLGCMGENTFETKQNGQPMAAILQEDQDQTDMTVCMAVADPASGQPRFESNGDLIPLELQDDQSYALVFVINTESESEVEMLSARVQDGGIHDVSAYNLAMDNLYLADPSIRRRAGTSVVGELAGSGEFVNVLSALTFEGSWGNATPWIEMDISESPGACFTTGTEDLSEEVASSVEVFPNPTTDNINIDVNFSTLSSTVTFDLMNINGELIKTMKESNVRRGRYIMPVNELPAGVYTLNVRSEDGFASKKVIITE